MYESYLLQACVRLHERLSWRHHWQEAAVRMGMILVTILESMMNGMWEVLLQNLVLPSKGKGVSC